jgi:hypothetical protein
MGRVTPIPEEWRMRPEERNRTTTKRSVASDWPTLDPDALYGLPGYIVETVEPHTEADPVAVLGNTLVAFGNAIGRGAFFKVSADTHHLNLNMILVGETSKGRKGMSWGHPGQLMRAVDSLWVEDRVQNGLSSGEGLIYAVRDRVVGENKDGEPVTVDPGVEDKRLLVMEGEFASVLKMMTREGNVLSPVVRQAWDGGKLNTLTKNSPLKATSAHISVIGHVTNGELLRHFTETEAGNGFGNRFLFVMVRRSKKLPFGGDWHKVDVAPLVKRLGEALEFGKGVGEVRWGEAAREPWVTVYGPLSEGKPGLFGSVVSRAEAQVVRLAAIYAVMDLSRTLEVPHLKAALALWQYAEDSARYIFGDATGDPVADRIMAALQDTEEGMTRNEIRDLFSRHKSAGEIGQALALLEKLGRIRSEPQSTRGRPVERWYAK